MKIADIFQDSMVLQRGIELPMWGWGRPAESIEVTFRGASRTTTVDAAGTWRVHLPAMEASAEPASMEIRSADDSITLTDIVIGDVWICSGQSNMGWPLKTSDNAEAEIAAANAPLIRMLNAPPIANVEPQTSIGGTWLPALPQDVGSFSAVGYYFAKALQAELDVPIGLINNAWGGTRIQAWMDRETLASIPPHDTEIQTYEAGLKNGEAQRTAYAKLEKSVTAFRGSKCAATGLDQGWADAIFDDSHWDIMRLPRPWDSAGHNYNGVFWFRHNVTIPESWRGSDLRLDLGACDKADVTFFNGTEVGQMGENDFDAWCKFREYTVPASLIHATDNTISVRAYSHIYSGGLTGPKERMKLYPVDRHEEAIPLHGEWRYKVEHRFEPLNEVQGEGNPNSPYILYNSLIHPIVPFAIKGAIWYQGESNTTDAADIANYQTLFFAMIQNWRRVWGQGDFPFGLVQLANHLPRLSAPSESRWANIREAQAAALDLPNVGMAVTIDIGEESDIHPTNKHDVGNRLAAWALGAVYHKADQVTSGPRYKSHTIDGSQIRITFDHIGTGLTTKDGAPLIGFAIAGQGEKYAWADATIEGTDTVRITSPEISTPSALRYAWADNPACNLYNKEGLPAIPFRA